MSQYDYIARYYEIRPKYGERVQGGPDGPLGTVKRERRSAGHYVAVQYDDRKHIAFEHPKTLIYLDRPETGKQS